MPKNNVAGNSGMPLIANLLKLESSILPRNNVATEKRIQKKKIGAEWSLCRNVRRRNVQRRNGGAESAGPNRRRRNVPDPHSTPRPQGDNQNCNPN